MNDHDHDDYYIEDDDPIEGYCMRCRQTVEMENPVAVWTRRGIPATRGECPDCGGTVFRMGSSAAHDRSQRPSAVHVGTATPRTKLAQETAYIAYAEADTALAEQVADDLQKSGIAIWLHEESAVQWAGGVHPALSECSRLVLMLSPAALASESVEAAWRYFKSKNKRIVIAQLAPVEPPDLIRRSPRFDLTSGYRAAFRQMVQALSG